jgi:hopanoid biosynthesis associated radical SAM protein HpnH
MGIPFLQMAQIGAYVVRQRLSGRKKFPLVLMLEPLFRCNLACSGCGKIDYPDKILNQRLPLADCLGAIDECGAPVVVIAGGEPLLHKDLPQIVEGAIARRKFVTVCTNALLLEKHIDRYKPNRYFNWSIHLDGDQDMPGSTIVFHSPPEDTHSTSISSPTARRTRGSTSVINAPTATTSGCKG